MFTDDIPFLIQYLFWDFFRRDIFRVNGCDVEGNILDKLLGAYESWTDPKYGDNPDEATLLKLLQQNMKEEVDGAFREFIRRINTEPPPEE